MKAGAGAAYASVPAGPFPGPPGPHNRKVAPMTDSPRQYLVAPRAATAASQQALAEVARSVPVLSQGGTPPTRLVVEMDDGMATELKRRYGDSLVIEPNERLQHF